MPDPHIPTENHGGLAPDTSDEELLEVWNSLEQMPEHQPTDALRREFYLRLREQPRPGNRGFRWSGWLPALLPAAGALLIVMRMAPIMAIGN